MKEVPLGQICEINPRKTARIKPETQCSFIPMEYIDDQFGLVTKQAIRQCKEVDKGYTPFQDNDILFAKITPCMENGKCAIAKGLVNGLGFGSTEFHVIRAKKDTLPEWVYYYLRKPSTRKKAEINMTGSAGQKRVPSSFLEELHIPLPPLPEQKRIAAILEKADRLRRLRRYALELSGTYLQSVFLEMFGDPVTNPKGWRIVPLGDMLSLSPHLGTIIPAKESGKQLCVRVGEVGEWNINLSECKYVSLEEKEFKRFSLYPGDIVLARAIGSEAHLGKLSIMGQSSIPVVFDSHLMRIRTDPSHLSAFFLACWLKTDGGRARFMQQARQTSVQFNVNTEQIVSIEIPVPPMPLQQKFVKIIQKHLRLQSQQREAARQVEHLFQTLLHKAFEGGLTAPDEEDVLAASVEVAADRQRQGVMGVPEPVGIEDARQMVLPME